MRYQFNRKRWDEKVVVVGKFRIQGIDATAVMVVISLFRIDASLSEW